MLEIPLNGREIKPDNPKGNQSWLFIGRNDAEAEAPILWPPDSKLTYWKRLWCWERLKAWGEEGNRGWDGWMPSLTQWTLSPLTQWTPVWAHLEIMKDKKIGDLQFMASESRTWLSNYWERPDAGKDWRHWLNECEYEQTPGDSEGQGSLVCCSSWGCHESDTTQLMNRNNNSYLNEWNRFPI